MQAEHNRRIKAIAERVSDKNLQTTVNRLVSPINPKMPTMTGYPKFHKDPVKVRPVISNINAPHSRSSRWAAQQLQGYVGLISEAHIKSTRDFHEKVNRNKAKGRLLSLDIKSLFTNIPVEETIDVIKSYSTGPKPLFKDLPIEPNLFCELLKVCTSFNQFSFAGKHYRQVTGVPMGSSLSPVLANIYMEFFETELLKDIPVDMRPTLWLRYVDDVFCCFKDMSKFHAFLDRLNNIRPSIQFTYELSRVESLAEGLPNFPANVMESLPFLELNVMRLHNGSFTFSIYRKPCHAGNYIHAYSYQPLAQKTTVVRSLYLRAYRFCDTQFLTDEENIIQQSFLKLGYNSKFIDKCKSSA